MTSVVIGGGVAGLVAALRLRQAGEQVVLLEAGDRLGGRVEPVTVGGVVVDGGAESFAVRGGTVRALLDDVGLGADAVEPAGSARVALPGRTPPLPANALLGIPAFPLATDVRRVLGARGAMRAYADRLLPVLQVGRYPMLGPMVRARMGERVLDRLVAPVVQGVYGVDPEHAPVDLIAPGLNRAITTTGSLSGAVLQLRTAAPAGSAAAGIVGGVHRLVPALLGALGGADVRTEAPVIGLHPAPHGPGFQVVTAREDVTAARVVLAADGAAALDLLRDAAPELAAMPRPAPAVSRAVLLLVDDARLDDAPIGSGVLRAPSLTGVDAVALTHVTAKWPWLAAALPPHRHVLRVAYRGEAEVPDARVRADLSALLGFVPAEPVARTDAVWHDDAPPLAAETVAVRRALAEAVLPASMGVAGAWTAGAGLAGVVGSAERAAQLALRSVV